MRRLSEIAAGYAMHGRRQAIILALLCGFLPLLNLLSAAVVALVTLRKGGYEGAIVLLWSLLPAALLWRMGDPSLGFLAPGAFLLGLLLRRSASWEAVILAAVPLGLLIQLSLVLQGGYVAQVEALMQQAVEEQLRQGGSVEYTAEELSNVLLGFYGAAHAFGIVLCLMLGRWWQSLLYNPGGFGQEFHRLRFDPRAMLVLLVLILAALAGLPPLDRWIALLSLPPLFGGLAALHGMAALKKLGTPWLVIAYLALLLIPPAVIVLGLLDSVFDFRKRIERRRG